MFVRDEDEESKRVMSTISEVEESQEESMRESLRDPDHDASVSVRSSSRDVLSLARSLSIEQIDTCIKVDQKKTPVDIADEAEEFITNLKLPRERYDNCEEIKEEEIQPVFPSSNLMNVCELSGPTQANISTITE